MSDRWRDALTGVAIFILVDLVFYFAFLRDSLGPRAGAYLSSAISLPWAQIYRLEIQLRRLKANMPRNEGSA